MKNPLKKIEETLKSFGFTIKSKDFNRPWGGFLVIDEIWQHTDKNNPSDGEDIIRVQDDFG